MRRAQIATGFAIAAAAVGLAASGASLYDTLGPAPAFCAETGCATVQHSAWSHPLGVPMPVLGIAFFAAALALSVIHAPRLRTLLALAGGAWAIGLILVQGLVLGTWCKLCLVADPAAIAYAVAVVAGARAVRFSVRQRPLAATSASRPRAASPRGDGDPSGERPRGFTAPRAFATLAAAGAVLGALALWTRAPAPPALPPGTPAFVVRAQVPGKLTIVEVLDFECPFCRRLQAQLGDAIARAGVEVEVVRKMLPLSQHAHALPAAVAYCCADAQGKGEAMAHALFTADPATLTPEGCERLAADVGCDLARYRRDLPGAAARVTAEANEARAAGVTSLPTVFIGADKVVGTGKSTDELVAMIRAANR